MEIERPTWDEYFISICKAVRLRATCNRGRNGAVIAKDKRLLATGYVGSPSGMPHCDDVGHIMLKVVHENGKETKHCARTIHAELNAITQAAKDGIQLNGSTIYTLMEPCAYCAKAIINSGIKKVVSEKKYHGADESRSLFKGAGVEVNYMTDEVAEYEDQ